MNYESEPSFLHGHTLTVMALTASRDGTMVVTGGRDYGVKVWDTEVSWC